MVLQLFSSPGGYLQQMAPRGVLLLYALFSSIARTKNPRAGSAAVRQDQSKRSKGRKREIQSVGGFDR